MKNIFKILFSMILVLSFGRVFARTIELEYSSWTTQYPSNIPEIFVENETRYHFYKIVDGQVEYDNGYYTDLPGYIKDESSAREFYRYITNSELVFNANNELVLDTNYCQKSFCYTVKNGIPEMINTNDKFESDYSNSTMPIVNVESVPFTGDNVMYYLVGLFISIISAGIILIVKKKKKHLIRA